MTTQLSSSPAPRIARLRPLAARVGLVGVGHHVYWPQFAGLLDEMKRKQAYVQGLLEAQGVTMALEIGPGKVLAGLVKRTTKSIQVTSLDGSSSAGPSAAATA